MIDAPLCPHLHILCPLAQSPSFSGKPSLRLFTVASSLKSLPAFPGSGSHTLCFSITIIIIINNELSFIKHLLNAGHWYLHFSFIICWILPEVACEITFVFSLILKMKKPRFKRLKLLVGMQQRQDTSKWQYYRICMLLTMTSQWYLLCPNYSSCLLQGEAENRMRALLNLMEWPHKWKARY